MRIIMLCVLLFMSNHFCYSQVMSNIVVTPSANALASGEYGDIPVSLYTGTPSIKVPIHEMKAINFSLPIDLNYHASGIRVNDIPGIVGLGWSLNAGGLITRSVVGLPDETANPSSSFDKGYWHNKDIAKNINDLSLLYSNPIAQEEAKARVLNGSIDVQPDIFFFNFNGWSGKIIIESNEIGFFKDAYTIPYQRLQIDVDTEIVTHGSQSDRAIVRFTITTPDGVVYTFEDRETVRSDIYRTTSFTGGTLIRTTFQSNTWYLSKIKMPFSGDEILFSYTPSTHEEETPTNEEILLEPVGGSTCTPNPNTKLDMTKTIENLNVSTISIHTKSGYEKQRVEFITSSRTDVVGMKKIDEIEIYYGGDLQRTFLLNYGYMPAAYNVYSYYNTSGVTSSKFHEDTRLMLKSIEEIPATELADITSQPKPYTFEYYHVDFDNPDVNNVLGYNLPDFDSHNTDEWGFYNYSGSDGFEDNNDIIDNGYWIGTSVAAINPSSFEEYNGANRAPNLDKTLSGMLQAITYPTGGTTSFEYDLHQYFSISTGGTTDAGGLRIKKIVHSDNESPEKDVVKSYEYKIHYNFANIPSGSIVSEPNFALQLSGSACSYYYCKSNSLNTLGTTQGSHIGYREVIEYVGGKTDPSENIPKDAKGVNGKVAYTFTSPADFPDINQETFPYGAGTSKDWKRGKLIEKTVFDNNNKLVHKTINEYNFSVDPKKTLYGVNSSNVLGLEACNRYMLESAFVPLIKTTDIIYYDAYTCSDSGACNCDDIDENNACLKTQKEFIYDTTNDLQLKEIIETNSDGSIHSTEILYPADYGVCSLDALAGGCSEPTGGGIITMKKRNMLNYPIETRELRNGELVGGSINFYEDLDPGSTTYNIQLSKEYILETDGTENAANTSQISSGLAFNNPYVLRLEHQYNEHGNLTETMEVGGPTTKIVWDPLTFAYPSQKIVNPDAAGNCGSKSLCTYYVHDPLFWLPTEVRVLSGSTSSVPTITTHYSYDKLGRLILVKDDDQNIIEKHKYHYSED